MLCLTPPVEKKPKAPWKCSFCLQNHKEGSKSGLGAVSEIGKAVPAKLPVTTYQIDLKERKKQMKKQR